VPIRVLLVDDSAVIRGLMSKALSADKDIEIVGSAANGAMAIEMAKNLHPDVVILDIEMPIMDGITALPELLKIFPQIRVIMASTLTSRNADISMRALECGASDYLAKPSAKFGSEVEEFYRELTSKIKALANSKIRVNPPTATTFSASQTISKPISVASITLADASTPLHVQGVKALAIASSTGGPQALMMLFETLKGHLLNIPIFITQHMPPTFTTVLAEHLGKISGRECLESQSGTNVVAGKIYLAAGDFHMLPEKNSGGQVVLRNTQDPQENFCRPAADPMLRALSKIYGKQLTVVVLTGMGQDGMRGAKEVVANGGNVIAQDEASCVVYGMPKAVAESKICRAVLPLSEIGQYLIRQIEGR
jgi:two-component system chemotaxis response regulator CheB